MKPTRIGSYQIAVQGVSYSVYQYQDNQGEVIFVAHKKDSNDKLYRFKFPYSPRRNKVVLPKKSIPYQPYCIATGLPVQYEVAYELDSFIYEWLKPTTGEIGLSTGIGSCGGNQHTNGVFIWERADDEGEEWFPIPNRFRLTKDGVVVYGDGYESGITLPWNDYPIPTDSLDDSKLYPFNNRRSIIANFLYALDPTN